MLAKRIIPCLDVTGGRVVKGTQFINLKDAGDPVELAQRYDKEGADELVFLDITASSDKRAILRHLVERCAEKIFIPFTVGGGIYDRETIRDILNAGADKVSLNTAAVKMPQLIYESAQKFGSQCIVVAIDARQIHEPSKQICPISDVAMEDKSQWEVYTHGGRIPTGIDAVKWAHYVTQLGAGEILLTSMDRDGTKKGYDLELTRAIASTVSIPVVASGGAGTLSHIVDALRVSEATLLASLLHFGELTIPQIKEYCHSHHIPVRR